jgi:hypothetical protein|tara:strand:+ start:212 stop:448 length:237 start_codon:yes stop_codon:yes gene_type:complete
MQNVVQKVGDVPAAIAITATGTGGLTIQAVTEGLSLVVLMLNLILALGGIGFLIYRFTMMRQEERLKRMRRLMDKKDA